MGAALLNALLRRPLSLAKDKETGNTVLPHNFASRFFADYDKRVAEPLWNETRLRGEFGF